MTFFVHHSRCFTSCAMTNQNWFPKVKLMSKSETEMTDLWIIEWETRMKCCEKYSMEIAQSKAMGSIERGGKLGTEEAM